MELPYAECLFRFRAEAGGRLPPFLGTTIRGALGRQLRLTACHNRRGECRSCLLRDTCVYGLIFLGHPPPGRAIMRKYPAIPQPFVTVIPWRSGGEVTPGTVLEVGWRLYGPAVEHFPILVFTMLQMGRKGLGRERIRFSLTEVIDGTGRRLYREDRPSVAPPHFQTLEWPKSSRLSTGRVVLEFHTPLRLRYRDRLCRRVRLDALLIGLLRRLQILSYFYGDDSIDESIVDRVHEAARACSVLSDHTRWVELRRMSGRQKVPMRLGGLIGRVVAEVPDGLARSLLEAGEVTHAGKATSFGFGRLTVREA